MVLSRVGLIRVRLVLVNLNPINDTYIPLSLIQKSGSEFSDGNIPRFCSVFQVIQAISSAKFSLVEEVDLSFNSVMKVPRTLAASLILHLVDV